MVVLSPINPNGAAFSGGVNLAAMAHRQSRVDYIHDLGLIATTGPARTARIDFLTGIATFDVK